jgi:4-amino-4-deoxy-L-arabinose transferase-like glycosyltransferase
MLIALGPTAYRAARDRHLGYGLAAFATAAGLLVMGTRAGVIGCFLIPAAILVANRRRIFNAGRWLTSLAVFGVVVLGLIVTAGILVTRMEQDTYRAQRFAMLRSSDFGRVRLARNALEIVRERPADFLFIGQGASAYRWPEGASTPAADALAEVDWLDLLGGQGLFFTVLLYGFYMSFLFRRRWVRNVHDPGIRPVIVIALLVYLGHGSLAGHALTGPVPSGVLAALLAYVVVRQRLPDPASGPRITDRCNDRSPEPTP